MRRSMAHMWQNKGLFAGILAVFAVLYVVLVKGFATEFQLEETSNAIDEAALGLDAPTKAFTLLGALFGTGSTTSGEAASVYQLLLFIIISLVVVWTLRQTLDGSSKLRIRDAYYKSMSPFVTYSIVLFVIFLHSIPALLGISIYSFVMSGELAINVFERVIWLLVMVAGLLGSTYLISSSLFASYIVTLPNMTPLQSLRSARKLVRYRRAAVIRRVLFLPVFVILCFLVIFLPLVLLVPVLAEVLFAVLGFALIVLGHSYFYLLYRELL